MHLQTRVLKNQYHDSVVLMLAAKELKKKEHVVDAAYMMGTDVNKALLKGGGLLSAEADTAQANDLIIAIKTDQELTQILDLAEGFLSARTTPEKRGPDETNTVRSAIREHPGANMAVISVAGAYAASEAREALAGGLHVLLFSDNVSLADEIALKKFAAQRGLLLMGPGAGTAIINGVGLGFANKVPRGDIGIISAAGTGLQEVSTLLAKRGLGISQAIGTGGRDLSKAVGGLMFFAAIDALQSDTDTKLIVLISKPPDAQIAGQLISKIRNSQKPIILCLLGAKPPSELSGNLHFTRTLEECALVAHAVYTSSNLDVLSRIAAEDIKLQQKYQSLKNGFSPDQKYIRALFSGGTLCYEAQVIWQEALSEVVYSNAPLIEKYQLDDNSISKGHCALDLGEEEFTIGRPHPMIDNELRIQRMIQEASDPQTAVILLDVVLGYGAHPNPAEELGDAIKKIRSDHHNIVWIASVIGTEGDPQSLSQSIDDLQKAGVIVCDSNAQAARLAAFLVE
ncbi:MAG: acyl-CoA synthetase FdrA [Chloroflexota bacterium]|nr:acyl-CoA synthetase FdrA [Chloroflexota bacterium]